MDFFVHFPLTESNFCKVGWVEKDESESGFLLTVTLFPIFQRTVPAHREWSRNVSEQPTLVTKSWNWKRNFTLIDTWLEGDGSRLPTISRSPKDKLKFGSKIGEWSSKKTTNCQIRRIRNGNQEEEHKGHSHRLIRLTISPVDSPDRILQPIIEFNRITITYHQIWAASLGIPHPPLHPRLRIRKPSNYHP